MMNKYIIKVAKFYNLNCFFFSESAKNIVWTGYGKRIPVLLFKADVLLSKNQQAKAVGGNLIIKLKEGLPFMG